MPHYGVMFENTGLLQVIRQAILADGPKVSWVMIADLGGYTLDFAMVALDLEDIDSRFVGKVGELPRIATIQNRSVSLHSTGEYAWFSILTSGKCSKALWLILSKNG